MAAQSERLDFNGLFASPDFQKLELSLSKFNVFTATDIENWEIKHTKFLRYLLDPNESHGLGDSFLQNFLWLATAQIASFPDLHDLDLPYSIIEAERQVRKPGDYEHGQKKSEKGSIDIFLTIPLRQAESKMVVVSIENKIRAKEGSRTDGSQLTVYASWLTAELQSSTEIKEKFFIYLTKRGDKPSDPEWSSINYLEHVVPAIQYTLAQHEGKISPYIEQVLKDYLGLLVENSNSDEQDEFASRICETHGWVNLPENQAIIRNSRAYVRHKGSLDILMKYSDDKRYALTKLFKDMATYQPIKVDVPSLGECCLIQGYAMRPRFDFAVIRTELVDRLAPYLDGENLTGIESKSPIYVSAYFDREAKDQKYSCSYRLILGRMKNQEQRQDLLKLLLEKFSDKTNRRVGAVNWTTINATEADVNVSDPRKWFERHCFHPLSHERPVLSDVLEGWVRRTNEALKKFIELSTTKSKGNAL